MIQEKMSLSPQILTDSIPKREEITVLPEDKPNENQELGWTVVETIGIAVVNKWYLLPWYKKLFHKRFWKELFQNLSSKR